MRIWFDTEFQELAPIGITLISLGAVREDGEQFYAEADWFDPELSNSWVQANVHPHLQGGDAVMSRAQLTREFARFTHGATEFWADSPAYDWVVLCQCWGQMIDRPPWWPWQARDLRHLSDELGVDPKEWPEQTLTEHHALPDALHHRAIWSYLESRRGAPEWRIVRLDQVEDVPLGTVDQRSVLSSAPDREAAELWSKSFLDAGIDVRVERRTVAPWVEIEGGTR
jgi:hypothetical protein